MKRASLFLLFMFVLSCFLTGSKVMACGTVRTWTEGYSLAKDSDTRLNCLAMITCRPVLEDDYTGAPSQDKLIAEMILDALSSGNACAADLALKDFLIFNRLQTMQTTGIYARIAGRFRERTGRPAEGVSGAMNIYDGQSRSQYCERARIELDSLRESNELDCAEKNCVPIKRISRAKP